MVSVSPADAAHVWWTLIDQPQRPSVMLVVPLNKPKYRQNRSHILPLKAYVAMDCNIVGKAVAAW